jgi:hypothetical protein
MTYARYLAERGDMRSFMKNTASVGLFALAAGALTFLLPPNRIFVVGDYFRSGPGVHLVMLGFVLIWLAVCWWCVYGLVDNPVFRLLYFWSRNVTLVYFIQWTIVGWGTLVLGSNGQSAPVAVLIGIVVLFLTHIFTKFLLSNRQDRSTSEAR